MRVLLHAPVNLNLIDGSAIWCASTARMLLIDDDIHVDLLLNSPLTRDINVRPLVSQRRFRMLDSWQPGNVAALCGLDDQPGPRLTPQQVFERITCLHAADPYDLLILRGGPICRLVAGEPLLAGRSWFYLTQHGADRGTIAAIASCNGRVACQTPLLQEFLERLLGPGHGRYVPLPPMVPRLLCDRPRSARKGHKLAYIGKFDPHYMVEEMLAALPDLRERCGDVELIVAGDKFHDPSRTGDFERRVTATLKNTPGVDWRGALTRDEVGELLAGCDLGCCWRSNHYDDSLELSTKALEYAAAGLPVLLNPSRINRLVFGADYPLFVDSPESFCERVGAVLEDDSLYVRAAEMALETCRRYTFAEVNRGLQPHLAEYRAAPRLAVKIARPRKLLFVGHDLKFCDQLCEHFDDREDVIVRVDRWQNHTGHDQRRSEELLRWADVIWCEWCLGNAAWYSARVRPGQRLLIRLHRQEITTEYPRRVTWSNVDHLICIAPHVRDAVLDQLDGAEVDVRLIYNTFDCAQLRRQRPAENHRRLGLLGYCPKLKNPLLAVEILDRLMKRDERWKLVIAGRRPQEYNWLWSQSEERDYYEQFERFIADHDLERHLVRQDWTDNLPAWYGGVDFILSTSDLEGSHQTIAEGMAAGCIPVVRRWAGAAEMYPNSLLFDTAKQAAELILQVGEQHLSDLRTTCRQEAAERFDQSVILPRIESLVFGE